MAISIQEFLNRLKTTDFSKQQQVMQIAAEISEFMKGKISAQFDQTANMYFSTITDPFIAQAFTSLSIQQEDIQQLQKLLTIAEATPGFNSEPLFAFCVAADELYSTRVQIQAELNHLHQLMDNMDAQIAKCEEHPSKENYDELEKMVEDYVKLRSTGYGGDPELIRNIGMVKEDYQLGVHQEAVVIVAESMVNQFKSFNEKLKAFCEEFDTASKKKYGKDNLQKFIVFNKDKIETLYSNLDKVGEQYKETVRRMHYQVEVAEKNRLLSAPGRAKAFLDEIKGYRIHDVESPLFKAMKKEFETIHADLAQINPTAAKEFEEKFGRLFELQSAHKSKAPEMHDKHVARRSEVQQDLGKFIDKCQKITQLDLCRNNEFNGRVSDA